ncbi:hypothetical protein ANCCEY_11767 [Ancylostoma ceylanicum]|uniref:Uncharacterized protein n=1 Tax=Ancylostoma ceylanicum TaxID=53326 RepID=A0A0D6LNB7_9BILA|nr:hypothetical protein ANCCEY_11767 [Ancylostoma ceylanicum]
MEYRDWQTNVVSSFQVESKLYDLHIDFNLQTGREDVRALKTHRWIRDKAYSGAFIRDIIPPLLLCQVKIIFGNNVLVSHWIEEIQNLYREKRLLPISLSFGGGCFSRAGADLRCFTERDFTRFVRLFIPDLKEVQLATSSCGGTVPIPTPAICICAARMELRTSFGRGMEEQQKLREIE